MTSAYLLFILTNIVGLSLLALYFEWVVFACSIRMTLSYHWHCLPTDSFFCPLKLRLVSFFGIRIWVQANPPSPFFEPSNESTYFSFINQRLNEFYSFYLHSLKRGDTHSRCFHLQTQFKLQLIMIKNNLKIVNPHQLTFVWHWRIGWFSHNSCQFVIVFFVSFSRSLSVNTDELGSFFVEIVINFLECHFVSRLSKTICRLSCRWQIVPTSDHTIERRHPLNVSCTKKKIELFRLNAFVF